MKERETEKQNAVEEERRIQGVYEAVHTGESESSPMKKMCAWLKCYMKTSYKFVIKGGNRESGRGYSAVSSR